jgi:hypothetical protein
MNLISTFSKMETGKHSPSGMEISVPAFYTHVIPLREESGRVKQQNLG